MSCRVDFKREPAIRFLNFAAPLGASALLPLLALVSLGASQRVFASLKAAGASAAAGRHVEASPSTSGRMVVKRQADGWRIMVRDGPHPAWSPLENLVVGFPRRREWIVYHGTEPDGSLIALSRSGQALWKAPIKAELPGIFPDCAGGDVLSFGEQGPSWGAVLPEQVENWPELLRGERQGMLDIRRRRVIWYTSLADVGQPAWTNGRVFLTIRPELSPAIIRKVARRHTRLPIWLEERRVTDRALLWRRRLPGWPPRLTTLRNITGRTAEFVFTSDRAWPSG
ncbi:MAG: hypothetical protein LC772_01375, partial [Chloroflexi bacterium]|nr:hypothetical protein [Chloroflexota bacterium]